MQTAVQPAGRDVLHIHSINQTRHIVYCPHSRLAARVDLVTSYAGPLKRRLAALICIVHPTRC